MIFTQLGLYYSSENESKTEEVIIVEQINLTVSLIGTREVRDNYQIFRLTGLLDAFSEPVFRKVVSQYLETDAKHVILVLAQIEFVDSSGIGALVHLFKQTKTANGSLQIVTNPRVTQTVKLMRLEKFLTLRNSLDEAIANIPQD